MKYKWILFDVDGTLFDFDKSEAEALKETFRQFSQSFEVGYVKEYHEIDELLWRKVENGKMSLDRLPIERFELFLKAVNAKCDPEEFSNGFLKNLANCSDLIEGAEDTVKRLSKIIGLVIITNGPKKVQRSRIGKSTIGDYFTDIVTSEEVGQSKPDCRIFEEALRRIDNPKKSEVLIVGDSLTSDIKGGNNFGIDTCWFNPSEIPCDQDVECQFEITKLSELMSIVS